MKADLKRHRTELEVMDVINEQPPSSPMEREGDGHSLAVCDVWRTMQGEGPLAGFSAVFVRLAGCNLQCPACDTDYTTDARPRAVTDIMASVQRQKPHTNINQPRSPIMVVTGGEPFRQNITPLCRLAIGLGYTVQIETNGTIAPRDDFMELKMVMSDSLLIVCSPKTPNIHPKMVPIITAFKYVLRHDEVSTEDGLPTSVLGLGMEPARPPMAFGGPIYVQPEDNGKGPGHEDNQLNTQAALASAMAFGYTLCLQMHKLVGMK